MLYFVFNCLGMPFDGGTIEERSLGGSESACYYVARELARRGHKVTVFTAGEVEGEWDGVRYQSAGQPTPEAPLGQRFHFYAENTPHDVLIAQRHPQAFARRYASKLNLLWLHDLALYRYAGSMGAQMWSVDAVLAVSEWHKAQVQGVYGFHDRIMRVLPNGVDLSLFENDPEDGREHLGLPVVEKRTSLLYTSRPERGLEYHVRPGGLMERLAKDVPEAHLYVCGYDNTVPEMADYYHWLWQRCEELPNVTNLGHLTKRQLADVMRQCDTLVYPSRFEETSCVTAMECMAAGLPMIASAVGALPETCEGAWANKLIPLLDGGEPDIDAFVDAVKEGVTYDGWKEAQLEAAPSHSWSKSVDALETTVDTLFAERTANPATVARHLLRHSDIYALERHLQKQEGDGDPIMKSAVTELNECYGFRHGGWKEHYKAYYEYEKRKGVVYGPEELAGNLRFEAVSAEIAKLPPSATVLDYGCAHGHYTVNLAKRFPEMKFVGVDLEQTNIDAALKWAKDDGVGNVDFYCGEYGEHHTGQVGIIEGQTADGKGLVVWVPEGASTFDCIIAAEVLEHVGSPGALIDGLARYLKDAGVFITTTPYGPVEAMGYKKEWPWRAHVHHLERADLYDMFGAHSGFNVRVAPWTQTEEGDAVGSYVCTFGKPQGPCGKIDYERKLKHLAPRGTVSMCCIVGDAETSAQAMLESVLPAVDEVVIALDQTAHSRTAEIIRTYMKEHWPEKPLTMQVRPSPLEIGFDLARNWTLLEAGGDWVVWLDSDEKLIHPNRLLGFARPNQFNGYAIPQQHLSIDPPGLLKTDLPVKMFRNGEGIKFFGVVHEHPEKELNKGVGHVMVLPTVFIGHDAYATEDVRRDRFSRNLGLLVRDREKYPDRVLGKALWLRDLAQMCRYELEQNGGRVTLAMRERAEQGIPLWETLLSKEYVRYARDFIEFYSALVEISGGGFMQAIMMSSAKEANLQVEGIKPVIGRFASLDHARRLHQAIFEEQTSNYESPYF